MAAPRYRRALAGSTATVFAPSDAAPFIIGADEDKGWVTYFPGLVDEVAFYDKVLTASDVQLRHDAGRR